MKSRGNIKVLTDKLLAHDLLSDGMIEKPFRVPNEEDVLLSQNEIGPLPRTVVLHLVPPDPA